MFLSIQSQIVIHKQTLKHLIDLGEVLSIKSVGVIVVVVVAVTFVFYSSRHRLISDIRL